jgi:hypothetical protein
MSTGNRRSRYCEKNVIKVTDEGKMLGTVKDIYIYTHKSEGRMMKYSYIIQWEWRMRNKECGVTERVEERMENGL